MKTKFPKVIIAWSREDAAYVAHFRSSKTGLLRYTKAHGSTPTMACRRLIAAATDFMRNPF